MSRQAKRAGEKTSKDPVSEPLSLEWIRKVR